MKTHTHSHTHTHTHTHTLYASEHRSTIELARQRGYTVEEAPVSVHEAMEADELFTTGTAVVVCSVGSMTYRCECVHVAQVGGRPSLCTHTCTHT